METENKNDTTEENVEVVPKQVELPEHIKNATPQMEYTRDVIRKSLENVDAVSGRKEHEVSLVQIWDEVSKVIDTNEHVRINLENIQTMIMDYQTRYYQRRAETDDKLTKMLEDTDGDPQKLELYYKERERYKEEALADMNHIQKLMMTATKLAQEYRQCILQKRYIVHISKVFEFKMFLLGIMNQHIQDPKVLQAIADDIRKASTQILKSGEDV